MLHSVMLIDYSSVLIVIIVACVSVIVLFLTAWRDCSNCSTRRLADGSEVVQVRPTAGARQRLVARPGEENTSGFHIQHCAMKDVQFEISRLLVVQTHRQ